MDWLCLNVPRDEMPEAFLKISERDPVEAALRAREEAVAEAARAANDAVDADDDDAHDRVQAPDPYVALLQRAMLGRLAAMGFSRAEAREALETSGWIEEDATYALLRSLQPASVGDLDVGSMDREEAMGERGEEAMALAAILEDDFADLTGEFPDEDGKMALEREQRRMWTATVRTEDDRWKPCVLEVHFPPGTTYPFEPPLVLGPRPELATPDSADRRRSTRGAGGVDDGRGGRVHPGGVAARTRPRDPRRARDDGRGGCGEGGCFSG